jgi:hypothetical protein
MYDERKLSDMKYIAHLTEPVLLVPGQSGETQKGKTLSGIGYLKLRNEKAFSLFDDRRNGLRDGPIIVRC